MELDGAAIGAFDFVDRTRQVLFTDEGLVRHVVEDKGVVVQRVLDPRCKLLACDHRAGGVIGIAEVNDIQGVVGDCGHEVVLSSAGEVCDALVSAVFESWAGVADHDVCVDVDGVDRIGDADAVGLWVCG